MTDLKAPSILNYSSFRRFLGDYAHYCKFKNRNWSYSVWARKLGLASKSTLIMVVNGSRNPGRQLIGKLIKYFNFSEQEESYFLHLITTEKRFEVTRVELVREDLLAGRKRQRHWLYFLLDELRDLKGFVATYEWVQDNILLSFPKAEVESVLKYFHHNEEREVVHGREPRELKPMSQEEIVDFHLDSSSASLQALLRAPKGQRIFRTSLLKISKDRIGEANEIITRAQSQLSALEDGDSASLYELHLHLFPLLKD